MKLDHIGIAVEDLDTALRFWRDSLGARCSDIEEIPSQSVRAAFIETGEGKTELLQATSRNSVIARFLASGRKGIHHIAYAVDDLQTQLHQLKAQGVRLIHEKAQPGSRGSQIAFIHPQAADGVLIELVQHAKPTLNGDTP